MAKAKAPTSPKNPAWVVTVGAMKGGSGKTMVVDNLAGCLSENNKVLVIDADPQANASMGLGIDIADPNMISLTHVLLDPSTPPEDAVVRAPIPDLPNLDVLPSSIMLFKTEFKLAAKGERIRLLSYYLQDNQDFFSRYDYIIIDTNPGPRPGQPKRLLRRRFHRAHDRRLEQRTHRRRGLPVPLGR